MKKVIKYLFIFLITIVIFCLTLTLVSIIPQKYIEKNTKESVLILKKQTNRLFIPVYTKNKLIMFDNYTDALMINTAYSIDTKTPFYSAMVARKNYIEGITEITYPDIIGELKSSSKYEELDQVGDLNDTVNKETTESFEYARYWHGYLVFLRPLLIIFNINQIRIFLLVTFSILAIVLLNLIYKKINLPTAVIFLLGMIICDYFHVAISLQGSPVFLITIIASIIILINKKIDFKSFFLIIGCLTCFFDFLTVPLITLCIPLIIYILIEQKSNSMSSKKLWNNLLLFVVLWMIGYFGIWIFKWILVDVIYNKAILYNALNQFGYRSGVEYGLLIIIKELLWVIKIPMIFSLTIVIILLTIELIKNKKSSIELKIKNSLPYLFIASIGIVWYAALSNHSYLHMIFTYRNTFYISIGIFLAIYNLLMVNKEVKR